MIHFFFILHCFYMLLNNVGLTYVVTGRSHSKSAFNLFHTLTPPPSLALGEWQNKINGCIFSYFLAWKRQVLFAFFHSYQGQQTYKRTRWRISQKAKNAESLPFRATAAILKLPSFPFFFFFFVAARDKFWRQKKKFL